ncbi:unnamed protein product [Parascedosporium putredinis]|uniref:YMC020W-like alpha/beta hydrolase domain-containing protein n=1 Tax=Parascedosporium putredinis TaxID=1442378 RepID=A0A9P1HAL0_9PEZI|nr:unnamed protein product [Parascedosporium putredinis]CAI8003000.1 unnamed protein product [Parascedosporium putredinis]
MPPPPQSKVPWGKTLHLPFLTSINRCTKPVVAKSSHESELAGETATENTTPSRSDTKMSVDEEPSRSSESTIVADAPPATDDLPAIMPTVNNDDSTPQRPTTSSGWLTWFGRSPAPPSHRETQETADTLPMDTTLTADDKEGITGPVPDPTAPLATRDSVMPKPLEADTQETEQVDTQMQVEPAPSQTASTGYWYGYNPQVSEDVPMVDATADAAPSDTKPDDAPQAPKPEPSTEAGELAIIGDGSESHPTPAKSSEVSQAEAPDRVSPKQPPAPVTPRAKNKRTRPQSMDIDVSAATPPSVHGLFPAAYLKPIIGQPTGTSIRFANLGAEAIRRWADANGQSDCVIEKVALEGEGKIADRVNNLWTLLLNWIEQLREADLVIVACHSQGVPVSIILLAKLIDLGIIQNAKIGVCAMAGVTLGPFPDYKSSMGLLMGAAAELWELANPASEISQRYEAALKEVLEYGVRITFIGSIDDQLVPMESAVCSPADHPYIYRAVFIDGRIHAPDFIAHLVGFALKLRNLGVSDHGLIRELSIPLAGSLYGGEGHSRLYFDDQVYDLAIFHALETTDVPTKLPCRIHQHSALTSPNPYLLPWVMRGLLEEDFVKTELSAETDQLLKQFDDWKPTTKALKDVKYRLEAVRSKL